ncbi:MAG: hypothetical protein ABSA83_14965 [Verrucomicrobiota bacterium]
MKTTCIALFAATLILPGAAGVRAQSINVPNADFGLPVVTYEEIALPEMISWEMVENPEQAEYGEIGVFVNNPAYTNDVPDDYIYNCDGTQAAYIFADVGLAIFQDYDSVDSTGGPPSHAFNATYQVGKSYQLQAGIIASTNFGQEPGVVLQMSLYYRDSSSSMVTVASSNVVYAPNIFTSITNFVTFELNVPPVQNGDAWAGQHIGIQFLSIIPDGVTANGYWDLGNVQLFTTPALINPIWSHGEFGATLLSEPGLAFQVLATTNLGAPLSNWSNVITVTNTSGTTPFVDPSPAYNQRFYQARQLSPPPS